MPDSNVMETMLHQLHYDAIGVSFLKVGSSFHPNCGVGLVSYIDLLYFFAQSTLGTCIEYFPKIVSLIFCFLIFAYFMDYICRSMIQH